MRKGNFNGKEYQTFLMLEGSIYTNLLTQAIEEAEKMGRSKDFDKGLVLLCMALDAYPKAEKGCRAKAEQKIAALIKEIEAEEQRIAEEKRIEREKALLAVSDEICRMNDIQIPEEVKLEDFTALYIKLCNPMTNYFANKQYNDFYIATSCLFSISRRVKVPSFIKREEFLAILSAIYDLELYMNQNMKDLKEGSKADSYSLEDFDSYEDRMKLHSIQSHTLDLREKILKKWQCVMNSFTAYSRAPIKIQ